MSILDEAGLSRLWARCKEMFAPTDWATAASPGLMSAADKAKLDMYEPTAVAAQWTPLWTGKWGKDGSSDLSVTNMQNYRTIALEDANNTICFADVRISSSATSAVFSTFFPATLADGRMSIRRQRITVCLGINAMVLTLVCAHTSAMSTAGVWTNSALTADTIVAIYGVK